MNQNNAENDPVLAVTPTPDAAVAEALTVEPVPMQPVQIEERIEIVDILRGFALFGILCVNMQLYTTPLMAMSLQPPFWPEVQDQIATGAIEALAMGKFYILFSFLFGLGISIQLLRAGARGQPFEVHHVRRMGVLLIFGLLHAYLLWMGDILQYYAVVGLLFLIFVGRRPKTLLICSAIFYVLPLILIGGFAAVIEGLQFIPKAAEELERGMAEARAEQPKIIAETVRIYSSGTFTEIMRVRAGEVLFGYVYVLLQMGPSIVAMFLLGMWAGKRGVFARLAEWLPAMGRLRWWALGIGLAGNLGYVIASEFADMNMPSAMMFLAFLGLTIGAPALTFFYVSSIALFYQTDRGRKLLAPLAYVGRMALTNYLLQTLICTTIFYSHGFGLYASLGPLAGLALTVLIYLLQIPFSVLWLKFFRFGPMEWLWRSLTYWKLQPMR